MIRRPHRRSMTVCMRPHEPLKVRTSLGVTDAEIISFLERKGRWIQKNLALFAKAPKRVERQARLGEPWMFQGRELPLSEAITLLGKAFVVWTEENVTLYWPESLWSTRHEHRAQAVRWIEDSLKREAEKLFETRIRHHAEQMQLFPKRLRLMHAKTRWGSCSSRGQLSLNWKLIGAPLHVIDSVVVHELAHLRHMNHSDSFWDLVTRFFPDYESADRWLKDHQHLL